MEKERAGKRFREKKERQSEREREREREREGWRKSKGEIILRERLGGREKERKTRSER